MSGIRCHRCGRMLADGDLRYQVAVRVRSMFDGVIPDAEKGPNDGELENLLREMEGLSEEELNRQVHEDDVFVMCPRCKEAFMENIYSHLQPQATPEHGRAHLIH
jgi:phage FluMu protein Com